MHPCEHQFLCVCTCLRVYGVSICLYVNVYVRMCACVYVCTCVCVYSKDHKTSLKQDASSSKSPAAVAAVMSLYMGMCVKEFTDACLFACLRASVLIAIVCVGVCMHRHSIRVPILFFLTFSRSLMLSCMLSLSLSLSRSFPLSLRILIPLLACALLLTLSQPFPPHFMDRSGLFPFLSQPCPSAQL